MGINKTPNELGHQSSANGYDDLYGAHHWRDNLVGQRPKRLISKGTVMFFSFDLLALFTLLGIVDKLSSAKEIIAVVVAILYLIGRLAILIVKFFKFIGVNSSEIKKGFKSLRDIFND